MSAAHPPRSSTATHASAAPSSLHQHQHYQDGEPEMGADGVRGHDELGGDALNDAFYRKLAADAVAGGARLRRSGLARGACARAGDSAATHAGAGVCDQPGNPAGARALDTSGLHQLPHPVPRRESAGDATRRQSRPRRAPDAVYDDATALPAERRHRS
ncbi:hypothetical protein CAUPRSCDRAFT_12896 [Caulochytrium protostelioides]|uniref:Uncharacterized protein n=1 Tax=Caulochytrium protostelioides TaxID=1555241 RepID=A0A4P9WTU7_9FUNG|nr:hypothetical protein CAUPRSCDRAFT_12896 [Caulochytrium protostelioides]